MRKKWEYLVVKLDIDSDWEGEKTLQKLLNKHGELGWELISKEKYLLVFKKEVIDPWAGVQ